MTKEQILKEVLGIEIKDGPESNIVCEASEIYEIMDKWLTESKDWISVENDLPEHSVEVLVWSVDHCYQGAFINYHSTNDDTYGNPIFQDRYGKFDHKATHWEPLPTSPKKLTVTR